jgi:hypothetical protein
MTTMRSTLIICLLALVFAAAASAAPSDTTGVTVDVNSGPAVSVAGSSSPSFGLTLNGVDQTTSYTLPLVVTDATGSGNGWNLTITSTTFANGSQTFPSAASTITGVTSGCASGSTCTLPTDSVADTNLAVPSGSSAPSAVKFYNATSSTGRGTIDVNATVQVAVPANVLAGNYTSTLTVASVSGP